MSTSALIEIVEAVGADSDWPIGSQLHQHRLTQTQGIPVVMPK